MTRTIRTDLGGGFVYTQRLTTREDFPPWGNWEQQAVMLYARTHVMDLGIRDSVFLTLFHPRQSFVDGVLS